MSRSSRSLARLGLCFVVATYALVTSGIDHDPPFDNPAIVPRPKGDEGWFEEHELFAKRAARGNVDLLFLGDSITAGWRITAPNLWEQYYGHRQPANFGIGGDHTQHLLWRLDHGELDGIAPKVVVLMIGTNNLAWQTDDQIVDAVRVVIDRVRIKSPSSRLILLGLTPRAKFPQAGQLLAPPEPRVALINARLAGLADGKAVTYLDFGSALLNEAGQLTRSIEPDFLHLSPEGYRIWADAMEPTLRRLMGENTR